MVLIYTTTMGFVSFKSRLKRKGQAMVELLLLMALLVPLLVFAVKTVRERMGNALSGFFTNELRTQVRYGYSAQEMEKVQGGLNTELLSSTQGPMPITMQAGAVGQVVHPVQRVQEGWTQ
jgi:hypothetical protein